MQLASFKEFAPLKVEVPIHAWDCKHAMAAMQGSVRLIAEETTDNEKS